ncbi:MAG: RNA polymerase sigma factor [Pseudomonadota bacterium]
MDHDTDGSATAWDLDEKELVRGLKLGQERAWVILVHRFRKRLAAIAYGMTLDREESLEVVQDVFVKAFRNMEQFRGDSGLMPWLRSITITTCMNWRRRWSRRFRWHHQPLAADSQTGETDPEKDLLTPESVYQDREGQRILAETLGKLPEKLRVVFVLKTLEELSYDDIARTLSITRGTVGSRLHAARVILAEAVGLADREGKTRE